VRACVRTCVVFVFWSVRLCTIRRFGAGVRECVRKHVFAQFRERVAHEASQCNNDILCCTCFHINVAIEHESEIFRHLLMRATFT